MTHMTSSYKRNLQNKSQTRYAINLKVFNQILFVLILGLGFVYLSGISDITVKSFALQEAKTKMARLSEEKLNYEQELNLKQSYQNIREQAKTLNMVAIGEIEYLSINEGVLAKK